MSLRRSGLGVQSYFLYSNAELIAVRRGSSSAAPANRGTSSLSYDKPGPSVSTTVCATRLIDASITPATLSDDSTGITDGLIDGRVVDVEPNGENDASWNADAIRTSFNGPLTSWIGLSEVRSRFKSHGLYITTYSGYTALGVRICLVLRVESVMADHTAYWIRRQHWYIPLSNQSSLPLVSTDRVVPMSTLLTST